MIQATGSNTIKIYKLKMGKLLKNNNKKCERYNEDQTFSHYISSDYIANQNTNDFGFFYYNQSGGYSLIAPTLIYDFDKYSYYYGTNGTITYLCDDYGNQYNFNGSGNYRSVGSDKLIHESDYKSINLNPTSSTSVRVINNNCGSWPKKGGSTNSFGGGVNLSYRPTSSDYIYIYLTNGPLNTDVFSHHDMTDPYVLGGDPGNSVALENNILRVYSTGNTMNYRNTNGYVNIHIPFNCIGRSSESGDYSIFYGLNTWLYLYSSASQFQGKKAQVIMYNSRAPRGTRTIYNFGAITDNIGPNVIGFPIFKAEDAGSYMVNYYTINVS